MQTAELNKFLGKSVKVWVKGEKHYEVMGGHLKGFRVEGEGKLLIHLVGWHQDIEVNLIEDAWEITRLEGTVWG